MKLIKDIEEHIKSILNLKVITLFLNDAWLPSNETVKIIREDDIIVVKSTSSPEILRSVPKIYNSEEIKEVKRKRKNKDKEDEDANQSVLLLQKELEEKRNELLQKQNKSPAELEITNDTFDDINTFLQPGIKKKRIRKHKKKATVRNSTPVVVLQPTISDLKCHKIPNLRYSGVHKRFLDEKEEEKAEESLEGNKPKEIESSTINENLEKVKNVDHLKKGTVEIVETCLRSLDTIRNEKSIDMEVSVQKTTDRLNQSNEFESQMSLCTEIGIQDKEDCTVSEKNDGTQELSDENWKVKLLSLINKDLESKVFHRKVPTQELQDVVQTG
ncbi:uncharacterized protein [Rhodnius prolixus]